MLEVRVKRRLVDGVRDHKDISSYGFAASDGELALVDRHLELWVADFTFLLRGKGVSGWFGFCCFWLWWYVGWDWKIYC